MSSDLNCPYCDAEIDICHDDGFGYEEGVNHEYDCYKCGKKFVFQTQISFDYDAEKADCLNDGNHVYKPTSSYPLIATRMRCIMCGLERTPTEIEWSEISKT